ncbi:MAG TPA: hypothetical protein VI911_08635 [Patescibacteria group bacterium]|nr:MAG: hypothetical protein UR43_C0005G0106 [candidate division TM6 bacterium GW2011_GWF2_33_332]HLD91062.1 hypothetical protein [Patescibacteria group bacterium]
MKYFVAYNASPGNLLANYEGHLSVEFSSFEEAYEFAIKTKGIIYKGIAIVDKSIEIKE